MGPTMVPGESMERAFVQVVDDEVGEPIRIPPGKPLPKEDMQPLRTWVDQGARGAVRSPAS